MRWQKRIAQAKGKIQREIENLLAPYGSLHRKAYDDSRANVGNRMGDAISIMIAKKFSIMISGDQRALPRLRRQ